MAVKLAFWLRRLADWLDAPNEPLLARARRLTVLAEARFGGGFGEAKRRDVYAQLIKEFPALSKRLLAKAIEAALCLALLLTCGSAEAGQFIVPRPPVTACAAPTCFPSALNTGYAPTGVTLTTYSGSLTISVAGTTIDSKDITGCVHVEANNVTIKRTRVHGCASGYSILSQNGNTGLLVEDTRIECPGTGAGQYGIGENSFISRRNDITGCENSIWAENNLTPSSSITIEDNFIHANLLYTASGCPPENCHVDGIQLPTNARNITIRHNRIYNAYNDVTAQTNSTITLGGTVVNTVITDNLLAGGQVTLYCRSTTAGPQASVTFSNNRWSTMFLPTVGTQQPTGDCANEPSFTGNVCHETGVTLTPATETCAPAPAPEETINGPYNLP